MVFMNMPNMTGFMVVEPAAGHGPKVQQLQHAHIGRELCNDKEIALLQLSAGPTHDARLNRCETTRCAAAGWKADIQAHPASI
jgi:hypothetical protein